MNPTAPTFPTSPGVRRGWTAATAARTLAGALLLFLAAFPPPRAGGTDPEREGSFVVGNSPDGSFRLEWTPGEPIALVRGATAGPPERSFLPTVRVTAAAPLGSDQPARSADSADVPSMPVAFVSPDARWIFVQLFVGPGRRAAWLYRRENPADPASRFSLAEEKERFDVLAWRFFDREIAPGAGVGSGGASPAAADERTGSVQFLAWSPDSGRLLVYLAGLAPAPAPAAAPAQDAAPGPGPAGNHPGRLRPVAAFCYYNTRSGGFELTARLRHANAAWSHPAREVAAAAGSGPGPDPALGLAADAEPPALRTAESLSAEGPELPAAEHLARAEGRLEAICRRLRDELSPTGQAHLRREQEDWAFRRDTAAWISANQSWSPFVEEEFREGQAVATEKRAAELEERRAEAR